MYIQALYIVAFSVCSSFSSVSSSYSSLPLPPPPSYRRACVLSSSFLLFSRTNQPEKPRPWRSRCFSFSAHTSSALTFIRVYSYRYEHATRVCIQVKAKFLNRNWRLYLYAPICTRRYVYNDSHRKIELSSLYRLLHSIERSY